MAKSLSMANLPPNEFGFAIYARPDGSLLAGPLATGTPMSVSIPIVNPPPGTRLAGLFHSHPRGVAYPSNQDLQSAQQVQAPVLCIADDAQMRCFRMRYS